MPDDGPMILFEHCGVPSYCSDISSSRSSRSPSSAPPTPTEQPSGYSLEDAAEDRWNLVPYDIPWGPDYYHYQTGTLPGPEGTSFFFRSPIPFSKRRTQKACNKCRQRKAKCSGSRPTCSRCLSRGYICEYDEQDKRRSRRVVRPRSRSQGVRTRRDPSEGKAHETECSSTEGDFPRPRDVQTLPPQPLGIEPGLTIPGYVVLPDSGDTSDTPSSSVKYCSPWDDTSYPSESSGEHHVGKYFDSPQYVADVDTPSHAHHADQPQGSLQHPTVLHAPRPVRCVGSPPFLSSLAQQSMSSSSFAARKFPYDEMLINMQRSPAAEIVSQIAIPQLPSIPSVEIAAIQSAIEYASHPQGILL